MHTNIWNIRNSKQRLGILERTYAQKRHLQSILLTISLMTQGHWVGNRILPVFIRWAHSDPHDPRPFFLTILLLLESILSYFIISLFHQLLQIYLMSQQAVHPQPAPQGNQQQQPLPQPIPPLDPMLEKGRALFQRLSHNEVQEYSQFRKLNELEMMASINQLQFWRNCGGPHSQADMQKCRLYLQYLKKFQSLEAKRRRKIPGILIDFTRWLHSLGHSGSTQETKPLTSQKDNTATYGSHSSSLQSYGVSHRVSDSQKNFFVEQDEARPLKSQ